jgi:hypothetical protein
LITDPPQFKAPTHKRPLILEATASPNPATFIRLSEAYPSVRIDVDVVTQDDPEGTSSDGGVSFTRTEAKLYIDYENRPPTYGLPYVLVNPIDAAPPSQTYDQKVPWRLSASWVLLYNQINSPGCHTLTLVVSHAFDHWPCPVCSDDYDELTWHLLVCEDGDTECNTIPFQGPGACPSPTKNCSDFRADTDAGGSVPCPYDPDAGAE